MDKKLFKILIVDDDDVIRETYAQIFKQKGADVLTAVDGIEGVDIATKEMPDVIMTGIIMPRMEGFQLIRTLSQNTQTKEIPIMVLSHLGREEDRKKADELRIDNFIVQGSMTPLAIFERARDLVKDGRMPIKLSFDSYALDAPKLAESLPQKNLDCPSCGEKIIIEITASATEGKFDAVLKCPKCNIVIKK